MRTMIAGSRSIVDYAVVEDAISKSGFLITEVVSGGARGVDTLGEEWSRRYLVPLKVFPADWEKYGKRAGPIRNVEMGNYAEALIAVWDGYSSGTKHMITIAKYNKLTTFIHLI